jgi:hypothetical protein
VLEVLHALTASAGVSSEQLERSRGDPRSAPVPPPVATRTQTGTSPTEPARPTPLVIRGREPSVPLPTGCWGPAAVARVGHMPLSDVYDVGCVFGYHVRGRPPAARSGAGHVRIDRRTNVPDVAPDAPRPKTPTAATGRGAVLADAPARRECALAYRVTGDAVLARAAPDPGARRAPSTFRFII